MPFTRQDFLAVFEAYNTAVWPLPLVLGLLAVVCVVLAASRRAGLWRGAMLLLGLLWLWTGVAYHWLFFTRVNPLAWLFGAAFVGQGIVFLALALRRTTVPPRPASFSLGPGFLLVVYALAVYPLLGQLTDHAFPRGPTFGAPCPITIFTFGVLLLVAGPPRLWVAAVPLLWALVGSAAAWSFGIWEDLGLVAAALIGFVGLALRRGAPRSDRSGRFPVDAVPSAGAP